MLNPSSPNLDEVIRGVLEEILQERVDEVGREMAREENQENALEVVPEDIEVVVEEGEARSHKGAEVFQKHLAKKIFVEERGFKELMEPFKEEIERRGWERLSHHWEPRVRALVKEFYTNLGEQRNMTGYVRGRWILFGERAIS